ncbi:MAG: VWA domain-containing protein [Planctomycetia bacterium]|nr:VWA domain-containing protein [Planctomycetia bacterium]
MVRLIATCVLIAVVSACQADEVANPKNAQDVLAVEIAGFLAQRPTVIYWVIDESVSMVPQRKAIAKRLDKICNQLNNQQLRSVVVSFGQRVTVVTHSPTTNLTTVINAIEQIPVDDSGVEVPFSAIKQVVALATGVQPKGNAIIVLFTDEVGNDDSLSERTTEDCRKARIPVYVVGVPAPFGRDELIVACDPRDQQDVALGVVNRGAESRFPEAVHLANDTPVDSGFGPFLLSKICADTGGAYFRANTANGDVSEDENARKEYGLNKFFSPETMKPYRPSYGSREASERELALNRAKSTLVETSRLAIASPIASLQMVFSGEDYRVRNELLGEAQKQCARNHAKIDGLSARLHAGLPDRAKVQEKRWQAGYDLALGRVLAMKVRADTYNMMLAWAKSGMQFKDKNSNTWELVPSDKTLLVGKTAEIARQAKALLEKVVAEHPGTPWAYYASEELKTPFGYEWNERHSVEAPKETPSPPKRQPRRI